MNSFAQALARFYGSSIGKKIVVALTALVLMGFLVGHLLGNLLVFKGPDAINEYAAKLQSLGNLLWAVRLSLLGCLVLHIVATVQLAALNRKARPSTYAVEATLRAPKSSLIMIWSGTTIAVFVIYHLMHFTWGTLNGYRDPANGFLLDDGHPNVYKMLIDGFSFWGNTTFYLLGLGLLCSHLSHGAASVFQTLGANSPKSRPLIRALGWGFALVIFCGFASIPLAVLTGILR